MHTGENRGCALRRQVLNHGYTYVARVESRGAGLGLCQWLSENYPHSTVEIWTERIDRGEVLHCGKPAMAETRVTAGDEVRWSRPPWEEPNVPLHYSLVHADNHVVVVNKPSGLPTMPAGGFLEHTLLALVRQRWPLATPAHRLGRGTSGLVVFALSNEAKTGLAAAWRKNGVEKVYRAWVDGAPLWEVLDIETPIGHVEHPKLGRVFAAVPAGRISRSRATVLSRGPQTLVEVQIFTGRPHQVRIHMASVGHPLAGDPLYTLGGIPRPDALPGDLGYWLHAYKLAFTHPASNAQLTFRENVPPEWGPR